MKTITFDFDNASARARSIREISKEFTKVGAQVVTAEADQNTSRRAGITFRNLNLTFADGQTVTLAVKSTGDVFEVKINGKVTPLREQDDHRKTILEIATKMEVGRAKFQAALARVRVPLPASIRTSRTSMLVAKQARRDELVEAISLAKAQYAEIKGVPAPLGLENTPG